MQLFPAQFPDLQTLAVGLTAALRSINRTSGAVVVLDREPTIRASTFPSEVVTCRLGHERERRLLVKYSAGQGHNCYGHRGGVPYEAKVYRHVLRPLQLTLPAFYGSYSDPTTGEVWLVIEYLEGSVRATKTAEPAMSLAAHWIGKFHAANELQLASSPMPLLNTYDVEYYTGWTRRTSLLAGRLHRRFPWLARLCERSEDMLASVMLRSPQTVIHGEYYPGNLLFREGSIYPVDWESAAIAVGEVDLASLTDRWPGEIAQEWELEYQRTRWPGGAPVDFHRTLLAARLYLQLRWLGDRPDWTTHPDELWRFEALRSAGERLALI
jgi:hypothetical protein